jgi:multiple sugar transport system substrate-binding protein
MPDRKLDIALISGPMYDRLYERVGAFEQANGIRVHVGYSAPHPELNAHLAALTDPPYDLVSTHTKYAPSQLRFLAPLDEAASSLELGAFYESLLDLARIDGRLFGIPRNIDVKLLYYRTDLVASPPSTWDDLAALAARLSHDSVHGFVFSGMESGLFGMFFELSEMGGAQLFPKSGIPDIDNAGGRWALELLRELYANGAVPRDIIHWHYDEVHRYFRDGRAAMVCDWPGYYGSYRDANVSRIGNAFRVARMPAGPSGQHKAYAGSHTFALTRRGAAKSEAIALLRFLTAIDQQRIEALNGSVPGRPALLTEMAAHATPEDAERWQLLELMLTRDLLVPPALSCYPEIENILWRTAQSAITGRISVAEALEEMEERIAGCRLKERPTAAP